MNRIRNIIRQLPMTIMLSGMLIFPGCDDWIYDDLSECKMYLRFNYDYNMLYANAFSKQVEEVTVFLFDEENHFIKAQSDSGDVLKNEEYLMEVSLPSGKNYTALSWCGHLDSYELTQLTTGISTLQDLQLRLKAYDAQTLICNVPIENLWYGQPVKFYRVVGSQTETINLVRNTNRMRIILKDVNSTEETARPASDFNIQLETANACYDYRHNLIATPAIKYLPYFLSGNSHESIVAEINTMRLFTDVDCNLSIADKANGASIFGLKNPTIDMIKYLLLTKMNYYNMAEQEYIDRQYDWNVIIYYSTDKYNSSMYLAMKIVINGWTVWTQEIDV